MTTYERGFAPDPPQVEGLRIDFFASHQGVGDDYRRGMEYCPAGSVYVDCVISRFRGERCGH